LYGGGDKGGRGGRRKHLRKFSRGGKGVEILVDRGWKGERSEKTKKKKGKGGVKVKERMTKNTNNVFQMRRWHKTYQQMAKNLG